MRGRYGAIIPPALPGLGPGSNTRIHTNDYCQHFVDTGQRPQNFLRDSDVTDRCRGCWGVSDRAKVAGQLAHHVLLVGTANFYPVTTFCLPCDPCAMCCAIVLRNSYPKRLSFCLQHWSGVTIILSSAISATLPPCPHSFRAPGTRSTPR